jgi:predicted transposase/invertase (TIGR01784 family)
MPYDDIIVPELLPPSEDGVFKTLMTHPDAEPVLCDVVESYLRFPVVKVAVKNVELPISDINEKRERFDVSCTVNDGTQFEIEMQSETISGDSAGTNHMIVKSRAIYHLCDLHSGQSGRNIRYDKLMRSYQMTFCGYRVFTDREDFIRRFSFRDEYGVELSDAVGIILVDLTKLGDVIKKPVETMTGEEMWSVFFAYGADPKYKDLLDKIIAAKEEIKMARELLQTISRDENERARFRARRKFQMDMEHSLIIAQDEALMKVARNALQIGMSIDTIITLTGLTREEIEGLRVAN